jgi:hypothetical protein
MKSREDIRKELMKEHKETGDVQITVKESREVVKKFLQFIKGDGYTVTEKDIDSFIESKGDK